ncbi:MAG: glycosyltransferase [Bacteroidota bacterium]
MRVVQTSKAYAPLVGGIETTITNLCEGLSQREGISVEALVCNHTSSMRIQKKRLHGVPVLYAPSWGFVASLPISPQYASLLAGMSGDILHVHEPFPLASLSVALSRRIRRNFSRIVVSWHSDIVRQRWALALYRPLIHKFLRSVDRILVSTSNLIDASEFLPMYRDRCEVIPLGVKLGWVKDTESRRSRVEEIRTKYGGPLILFVGRLVYYKGLEYLIESLSLIPDARLVMIGSGPLQSTLDRQIAARGLQQRVSIVPPIPAMLEPALANELYAFYEACDILVLPSTEKSETYGLVQIEAMAAGKPVVSTNLTTGVTFVNIDGVTGLTVPPRDPQALANAIKKLINDPGLCHSLGATGRERALREFSAETMVDKTVMLYNQLLKKDRVRIE